MSTPFNIHPLVTAALLLVIVALASFLRWSTITERNFFFDELWIVELSNGRGSAFLDLPTDRVLDQPNLLVLDNATPLWRLPATITGAIHPPGTFVMLRLWRYVFGDSMMALRSASTVWSVGVVVLTFLVARRCFGTQAGLWAALMSAISFGNIDQAQDVRGYTMLQAIGLLTVIALLRMRGKSHDVKGAIGVGAGVLAMMFTHYFALGACLALGVGAIILLHGRARLQALGAMAIAAVAWCVLWIPSMKAQLAYIPGTADIFLLDHSDSPLLQTLLRLLASPYQALVGDPQPLSDLVLTGGAILTLLLLVRVALPVRADVETVASERRLACFWLMWIAGVLGVLLAIDLARQSRHLEYMKYFLLINPALCVLLSSFRVRPNWLLPALVSVCLGVLFFTTTRPFKPDNRQQLADLQARVRPGDLIILPQTSEARREGQVTYLFVAHTIRWPVHQIVIPQGPQSAEAMSHWPTTGRWFYVGGTPEVSPKAILPAAVVVEQTRTGVFELKPPQQTKTP